MQYNKVLIIISPTKIATLCCSVSFPESRHSELYWAVRREQILNKREFSKASSSILNSVLFLIEVHYFHMNRKETKLKRLSESRFGSIIFLFRMVGIPLKTKIISIIYSVYMITVIICGFSTFTGMFVDVYIHWDDLGRAMTSMRVLIPFTNVIWIFSYCR